MKPKPREIMEKPKAKFIGYLRVSSDGQGMGLQGQLKVIRRRVEEKGGEFIGEPFTEKKSGKYDEETREQLKAAIRRCRVTGATLIVQALDRLGRDMADLTRICFKEGIKVCACDMSEEYMQDPAIFGLMAGLAQREREKIAGRVQRATTQLKETHLPHMAALHAEGKDDEGEAYWKAVKSPRSRVSYADWIRKGFKLGTPQKFSAEAIAKGVETRKIKAKKNERNEDAIKAITEYLAEPSNKRSLRAIEEHLKAMNIMSPKGTDENPKFYGFKAIDLLCRREGIDLGIPRRSRNKA